MPDDDKRYGLDQRPFENTNDVRKIASAIWGGKWIIVSFAMVFCAISAFYSLRLANPLYSAVTRVAIQPKSQPFSDIGSALPSLSMDKSELGTELEVVKSRAVLDAVVRNLKLIDDPEFNITLREFSPYSPYGIIEMVAPSSEPLDPETTWINTVRTLRSSINVIGLRDTYIFDIRSTTSSRTKSQRIANEIAERYIKYQIETEMQSIRFASDWLSEQTRSLKQDIGQLDNQLKSLRLNSDLASTERLEATNVLLQRNEERLRNTEENMDSLAQDLALLETALEALPAPNSEALIALRRANPVLDDLIMAVENGESGADEILRSRLEQMHLSTKSAFEREVERFGSLQNSVSNSQQEYDRLAEDLSELSRLEIERETTQELYDSYLSRLKATSGQTELLRTNAHILSPAAPGDKISPRTSFNMFLSFFLGGLAATVWVLYRTLGRHTIRSTTELEALSELSVLGDVPSISGRSRKNILAYLLENPTSRAVESIRNIRTSLMMMNRSVENTVLMITSSVPGEGKTTISLGLCANYAQLGKSVLLIEGDLRRRTLNEYFDKEKTKETWTKYLGQSSEWQNAVYRSEEAGFDVLFGEISVKSSADLFVRPDFQKFIMEVRSAYDVVIIDTPPAVVVPDARIIASCCDQIVFVAKWDSTPAVIVQEGLKQFSSLGRPVDGLILSQVNSKRAQKYGGSYYSYELSKSGYYDV